METLPEVCGNLVGSLPSCTEAWELLYSAETMPNYFFIVPCIVAVAWLAGFVMTDISRRRTSRVIQQGIADYLREPGGKKTTEAR